MTQTNRFTIHNQKGGTGKTTIGINVAGALNARGEDVLFVDLDPQGNATEGLGMMDAYDEQPPDLYDVLLDGHDPDGLIREHQEFDVLPSNVDMMNAERSLVIDDYEGEPAYSYLDRALEGLDYDYIIVDAPPFFGELTDNALYATRNVLIPALTESTSERAVELLLDQMERLEDDQDIFVSIIGVVANRIETTNEAERMREWLDESFPDAPVFNIRKRVALQRAYKQRESLFEYEPNSDMVPIFEEIADTIIEHYE